MKMAIFWGLLAVIFLLVVTYTKKQQKNNGNNNAFMACVRILFTFLSVIASIITIYSFVIDLRTPTPTPAPTTTPTPLIADGDIIEFGKYDGAIQWQVLSVEAERIFLISLECIDCQEFNSSGGASWETCSLRKWLNTEFLSEAFSEEEQDLILLTTVKNNGKNTSATKDKVYLLSFEEAKQYFPTEKLRKAVASVRAVNNGAAIDKNGVCQWWLRTRGDTQNYAAYVGYNGKRDYRYNGNASICVRPVIWISRG